MTDLTYLDINYNYVKDISPLLNLKKLEVLGMADNPVTDPSLLCDMDFSHLQMLYICSVKMSEDTSKKIQKKLPDGCTYCHVNSAGDVWFGGAQTRVLRANIFPKWKSIKEYHDIDDVVWYDKKPYAKDDIEQLWKTLYGEDKKK